MAAELHLAPNTVSTLVGTLSDAGWLLRTADPLDGRSTVLELTAEAERRVEERRDRRLGVLDEALARLPDSDRAKIESALPALARLLSELQEGT